MCADLALSTSGSKQELVDRILCHDAEKPLVTVQPDEEAELLDNDSDVDEAPTGLAAGSLDEDIAAEDEDEVGVTLCAKPQQGGKRAAMPDSIKGSSPAKVAAVDEDQNNKPSTDPPVPVVAPKATQDEVATHRKRPSGGSSNPNGRVLDEEKKLERARRFGLPVNPNPKSHAERLQARAARFGESAVTNSANGTKSSSVEEMEERKRRRLEKFGPVSAATDDESEKKAQRAARFGLPTKPTSGAISTDPEVLRKRAERFGLNTLN
ncbi:unnamed protein product [Mesocestoides corti]|nr:unnamed protein product [Mesocestoides corti]